MHKRVPAIKARQNLGTLLEEVYYKNDCFIITRRDKAMAVVIPVVEYEQLLKQRERDFAVLDEIRAATRGKRPQQVEQDVARAIREVRAKKRRSSSPMPRVVLDTSVIVSGTLIDEGHPATILDAWRDGRSVLVISERLCRHP